MSEDNIQESVTQSPEELDSLKRSIEALERKNHELIGKLKDAKSKVGTVPDGVDINELIEFKKRKEQEELETQGKYSEAKQALEQQYRELTSEKDKRIAGRCCT
jgi:predicted RNase H-like nuclease (RuvC/YqgF family)